MNHAEHDLAKAFIKWKTLAQATMPVLWLLHHIPNGGRRSPATAGKLKAEGTLKGVADYFLPVARGPYHGFYIELKTDKGTLSPEQRAFADAVTKEGYLYRVVRTLETAIAGVTAYLKEGSGVITKSP